jgi:MFS family permease
MAGKKSSSAANKNFKIVFPFSNLSYILEPFTQSIEIITKLPSHIKKHRKRLALKDHAELKTLPARLTPRQTKESLKNSINDGISASVTAGITDNSISPFAIAMGASNSQIAMLTSIPNLIAPALQLRTPKKIETASRKTLIVRSVLLQSLMLVPIALLAFLFLFKLEKFAGYAPLLLVLFFTLYVIFGSIYGPAWASWIGDIVPGKLNSFFVKRNIVCGIAALVATLFVGFFLDLWPKNLVLAGFAILFVIAMIARLISRHFLSKKFEPRLKLEEGYYFTFLDFIKRIRHNNFGRFVIYVAAITLANSIAGPFYAVYMLKDLQFSYLTLIIVNITAAVSTLIAFNFWGRFSEKNGNIKMLKFCGMFLVPALPLLWLVSSSVLWLIFVQILSGIAWAGFNLAAGNFVYDTTTPQRRSLCVAYQNVINGLAVFAGATLGGFLATHVTSGMKTFMFIFLISGILRFLFSVFMLPALRDVKRLRDGRIVFVHSK